MRSKAEYKLAGFRVLRGSDGNVVEKDMGRAKLVLNLENGWFDFMVGNSHSTHNDWSISEREQIKKCFVYGTQFPYRIRSKMGWYEVLIATVSK